MESFLEALRIVSESWPLTFMFVALVGGIAIASMVRTTNRASVQRKDIEAQKEIDIKRMSDPDVRDSRGLPKPRQREAEEY